MRIGRILVTRCNRVIAAKITSIRWDSKGSPTLLAGFGTASQGLSHRSPSVPSMISSIPARISCTAPQEQAVGRRRDRSSDDNLLVAELVEQVVPAASSSSLSTSSSITRALRRRATGESRIRQLQGEDRACAAGPGSRRSGRAGRRLRPPDRPVGPRPGGACADVLPALPEKLLRKGRAAGARSKESYPCSSRAGRRGRELLFRRKSPHRPPSRGCPAAGHNRPAGRRDSRRNRKYAYPTHPAVPKGPDGTNILEQRVPLPEQPLM